MQNIIFDFDGTLTDSKYDIASAQVWVLQRLGITSLAQEDLFRFIGKPLEETFAAVLPDHMHHKIPEAAEMYDGYYRPRSLNTTRLFPGVRETLEVLRSHGKNLAVASTKRGPNIKRVTDHFGITEFFIQLQGSDGFPFKPDPSIINKIIDDQHWRHDETVMVGDTDYDIFAGKNAGIATCAVSYGAFNADQLKPLQPDFIIDSFPQLLSVVS